MISFNERLRWMKYSNYFMAVTQQTWSMQSSPISRGGLPVMTPVATATTSVARPVVRVPARVVRLPEPQAVPVPADFNHPDGVASVQPVPPISPVPTTESARAESAIPQEATQGLEQTQSVEIENAGHIETQDPYGDLAEALADGLTQTPPSGQNVSPYVSEDIDSTAQSEQPKNQQSQLHQDVKAPSSGRTTTFTEALAMNSLNSQSHQETTSSNAQHFNPPRNSSVKAPTPDVSSTPSHLVEPKQRSHLSDESKQVNDPKIDESRSTDESREINQQPKQRDEQPTVAPVSSPEQIDKSAQTHTPKQTYQSDSKSAATRKTSSVGSKNAIEKDGVAKAKASEANEQVNEQVEAHSEVIEQTTEPEAQSQPVAEVSQEQNEQERKELEALLRATNNGEPVRLPRLPRPKLPPRPQQKAEPETPPVSDVPVEVAQNLLARLNRLADMEESGDAGEGMPMPYSKLENWKDHNPNENVQPSENVKSSENIREVEAQEESPSISSPTTASTPVVEPKTVQSKRSGKHKRIINTPNSPQKEAPKPRLKAKSKSTASKRSKESNRQQKSVSRQAQSDKDDETERSGFASLSQPSKPIPTSPIVPVESARNQQDQPIEQLEYESESSNESFFNSNREEPQVAEAESQPQLIQVNQPSQPTEISSEEEQVASTSEPQASVHSPIEQVPVQQSLTSKTTQPETPSSLVSPITPRVPARQVSPAALVNTNTEKPLQRNQAVPVKSRVSEQHPPAIQQDVLIQDAALLDEAISDQVNQNQPIVASPSFLREPTPVSPTVVPSEQLSTSGDVPTIQPTPNSPIDTSTVVLDPSSGQPTLVHNVQQSQSIQQTQSAQPNIPVPQPVASIPITSPQAQFSNPIQSEGVTPSSLASVMPVQISSPQNISTQPWMTPTVSPALISNVQPPQPVSNFLAPLGAQLPQVVWPQTPVWESRTTLMARPETQLNTPTVPVMMPDGVPNPVLLPTPQLVTSIPTTSPTPLPFQAQFSNPTYPEGVTQSLLAPVMPVQISLPQNVSTPPLQIADSWLSSPSQPIQQLTHLSSFLNSNSPNRSTAIPQLAAQAVQAEGHGQPLPLSAQEALQRTLGTSVSDVRVVRDPQVQAALQQANAEALTIDKTILLPSEIDLETPAGHALAAHEYTHALRQKQPQFVPEVLRRQQAQPQNPQGKSLLGHVQSEEEIALATEHAAHQEFSQYEVDDQYVTQPYPGLPAPNEPMPFWSEQQNRGQEQKQTSAEIPSWLVHPDAQAEPAAIDTESEMPPLLSDALVEQGVFAASKSRPAPASAPPPKQQEAKDSEHPVGSKSGKATAKDLDHLAYDVYNRLRDRLSDELRRLRNS